MASIETFEQLRPRLMAIAYRMLGAATEAEDVVQDVWLRWQDVDEGAIRDPGAWLATALSRLCIDRLTSARARREAYPGPWLPEPVVTQEPVDVESISLGFLVLLERLTPVERAAFVLHQVFDLSHAEVAGAVGMSEAAARQVFHRARAHIEAGRPRFAATREQHVRLLHAFAAALSAGDVDGIAGLLTEDATAWADSGGKVPGAARRPVRGAEKVARFFAGLVAHTPQAADMRLDVRTVNGWPALVAQLGGQVLAVLTIETDGVNITVIRNQVNPEKLALPTLA